MIKFTSLLLYFLSVPTLFAAASNNAILIRSQEPARVIALFKQLANLAAPATSSANQTECGYIFPQDTSKFGCKGTGKVAADIAAACSGGSQLVCTGSGTQRTCSCAFET